MKNKRVLMIITIFLIIGFLFACAAMRSGYIPPFAHPEEEGEDLSFCTDCHDISEEDFPYGKFNHTGFFAANHRQTAYQNSDICSMCHRQSYCDDCHAVRVELKPSTRYQTENYRWFPHRGDYLTRHRFDGRIDPTSCFRCHGNPKTAKTCVPCHG